MSHSHRRDEASAQAHFLHHANACTENASSFRVCETRHFKYTPYIAHESLVPMSATEAIAQ